jgi:hypothetical protein
MPSKIHFILRCLAKRGLEGRTLVMQQAYPMPYFLAQPRPATVLPFGRYSQPIQPW